MPPGLTGTRLGRYEIRSRLGAGGMGEVYLAEDTQLGRRVALKVLRPEDQADAQARKRLEREARAAATLDHPHICAVYEVGEAGGLAFIAMQFIDGQTLEARLRQSPLDLAEALAIAVQVVDAVADAHEHGILHRDLKPANIMVTARGQAKVMDFGLAKIGRADGMGPGDVQTVSLVTNPGAILGTIPYMSPEQVRGAELDRRSDLFSVGVLLYEMVAGRRPFDDSSAAATASAILTREPLPLARFAPDTPAEVERIVGKALRKDPEDRYQTARDLLVDLRAVRDDQAFQLRLERSGDSTNRDHAPGLAQTEATRPRWSRAWLLGALVIGVAGGGGWWLQVRADARWALAQAPQIAALAEAGRNFEAYDLAVAVESYLPADPVLTGLMPSIADAISVTSEPAGARVYLKRFVPEGNATAATRELLGTTPLKSIRIGRGEYILSVELDGYATYERTVSGVTARTGSLVITPAPIQIAARLVAKADLPPGMVFVPGSPYRLITWSRPTDRRVQLGDYFIDKYEVSNDDYKAFITAGGYVKREYWAQPLVKDGQSLTWDAALALVRDRTGLPGPRGWSDQNPPEGTGGLPVTGVSWYEAAAYAAFRGGQLPNVFQWEKAARNGLTGTAGVEVMPWGFFYPGDPLDYRANFGSGPLPVTSGEFGMSPFGAHNMAGNVAEWTRNDSSDGYLATGGAWGDPTYAFRQFGGRPGFFTSSKLGFRVARPAAGTLGDEGSERIELDGAVPVFVPTSVATFETLAAAYRYDPTAPLDAKIDETLDTPDWTRERITFNGAAGERVTAYLYVPRHVPGPLQVLHYVPAGDVDSGFRPLDQSTDDRMGPFIKSGRAAFAVVLDGYIGRIRPEGQARPDSATVEYLERFARRVVDSRRGLDYLQTRTDIDRSRIGFLAPSAGSRLGLVLAAVEPRYRAVVLIGSGLPASYAGPGIIPQANPVNFASHIRASKLIVQGRYDEDSPLRTTAEPLFKLLSEPKQFYLYDGGHVPPTDVLMAATRDWLDQKMGPVRRAP